jgi:crotonobetainyl-CoA:carnitine CoA-transferase CaiB-like acyl-CoA transferase
MTKTPTPVRALDGVVVLDLGQVYNGPYCTMLLAHLGAEIIKIEPFGGEPVRGRAAGNNDPHEFRFLNGGKRSLRLDLKKPAGKDVFLRLAAQADVVVENFSPGTMNRLGLGYHVLSTINPRLILASGTGFAPDSPYRDTRAMDLTVQAMTAVMATTGFPDQEPTKTGPAIADFLGGIHLMAAVTAALYQRTVTGRGQCVEVAMQDAVVPTLASNISGFLNEGTPTPERTGNRHGGLAVCPYNSYPTADGSIAILCLTNRHWAALCSVMNRLDLAEDPALDTGPGRVAEMDKIDHLVGEWTRGQSRDELFERLQWAQVPSAPVLSLAEMLSGSVVGPNGMLRPISTAGGHGPSTRTTNPPAEKPGYTFGSPLRMTDSPPAPSTAPPALGAHSDDILAEKLGLTAAELADLHVQNVI